MEPAREVSRDPFSFDIQLRTEDAGRNFHRKNYANEIQRPDVVDDICRDLLLQARIDRIVHGHESTGGSPSTFIVFGFRFHGINEQRRFREAIVTISFRDEGKVDTSAEPEVVALWPNGDFTLGEPIEVDVEEMNGGEIGAEITAGGFGAQGGVHGTRKWERRQNYKKTTRSTLTGSIILDTSIRDYGANNAVRLTIRENSTASSGVTTDFRVAVLLRRKSDNTFLGAVKMKATADFLYNAIRGIRDISGLSPANDPVRFKPSVQYLRSPAPAGFLGDVLNEAIPVNSLNHSLLDGLASRLGNTALAASGIPASQ